MNKSMIGAIAILGLTLATLPLRGESSDRCSSLLAQGRESLSHSFYVEAESAFDQLASECKTLEPHDSAFFRALARQLRAQDFSLTEGQRTELLNESRDLYEGIVKTQRMPGAFNNLGDVYFDLGDLARAKMNYEHAISLRPTDVWLRASYALFLAKTGQTSGNEKILFDAEHADPTLWLTRRLSFEMIRASKGEEDALQYLSNLIEKERSTVENVALELMRDRKTSSSSRKAVLVIIARCLAADSFLPREFAGAPLDRELSHYEKLDDIGAGVQGLLAVATNSATARETLSWWKSDQETHVVGDPSEVMCDLLTRIGTRLERAGDLGPAASYFLLLMRFSPDQPDLTGVSKLGELYVIGWPNDPSQVLSLAKRYNESALAAAGSEDVRKRGKASAYARAMSILLTGFLSRETSEEAKLAVANAILVDYDLILAAASAGEPSISDPQLSNAVALAQRTLGHTSDAAKTRLNVVRECVAIGKPEKAQMIIKGFSTAELATLSKHDREEIEHANLWPGKQ